MKILPKWYQLLHYWCRKKRPNGIGLTIPFLVGCDNSLSLEELFIEIRDMKFEETIVLQICPDLNQYIISLDDKIYPVSKYLKNYGNLYFDDEVQNFKDFESILSFVRGRYEDAIIKEKFSYDKYNDEWKSFNDLEKNMIKIILD